MTQSSVVGHEIGEAIRQAIPPELTPLVLAVTFLGNVALFLVAFTLDYWFGDHRRGAHALGLAIGGMALVVALKHTFDAPRPPDELNVVPVSGFTFPSGHAATATIGFGILAVDLRYGTRRTRYAVAAVLAVLVALSRVALGVHFVRDVVAGIVVGVAYLAIAELLTGHEPRAGFWLAVAIGAAAAVISGGSQYGLATFGGAVGAALTWEYMDAVPAVDSRRGHLVLVGVVLPILVAVGYVSSQVAIPQVAVFALGGVIVAAILTAPLAVGALVGEPATSEPTST